jgi:hypothetical protein
MSLRQRQEVQEVLRGGSAAPALNEENSSASGETAPDYQVSGRQQP